MEMTSGTTSYNEDLGIHAGFYQFETSKVGSLNEVDMLAMQITALLRGGLEALWLEDVEDQLVAAQAEEAEAAVTRANLTRLDDYLAERRASKAK